MINNRLVIFIVVFTGLLMTTALNAQHQYMRAHYIDVGQGDATLLEFPCSAVMIDSGTQHKSYNPRLVEYLNKFFERRTDLKKTIHMLFVTHTHKDHNQAIKWLVKDEPEVDENLSSRFTINYYVHNDVAKGSGRFAAKWILENADQYSITPYSAQNNNIATLTENLEKASNELLGCNDMKPNIQVLSGKMENNPGWSSEAWKHGTGNNQSLVIRVDFGGASFLFTGDLEEEAIDTLVNYHHATGLLDVDVYQVGHHGSYNGTTIDLLKAMSPVVAVISMGRWDEQGMWTAWAYGHPRKSTIDLLKSNIQRSRRSKWVHVAPRSKTFNREKMNRAIFGTGWDGTVVVHARSDGRLIVRRQHH